MNLSPKKTFQSNEQDKKTHKELVVKDHFVRALEVSLAEMTLRLPRPNSPSESWDQGCKLHGAREFIDILLNLAEEGNDFKPLPNKALRPDPTLTK